MGGWFHGTYWTSPLTSPYTAIPIAALEFIAAMTSIISFASLLPEPSSRPSLILHVRVDALSTPYILTDDSAASPMMVELHSFIIVDTPCLCTVVTLTSSVTRAWSWQ